MTVASYEITRGLSVIDVRLGRELGWPSEPVSWFAAALARPTHRDDRHSYVATQFVSAHLRREGFDGILYGSSLQPNGHNLALFDPSSANPTSSALYQVTTTLVESEDVTEPYDEYYTLFDDDA